MIKPRVPTRSRVEAQACAVRLQALIRARGDYTHVGVRAHGAQLIVEVHDGDEPYPVARLTSLGAGEFGLSFHRHTGRWEPMPFVGPLEDVADDLIACLAPYLERRELPVGISGTGH